MVRYFHMTDYQCPWLVVNSASGSHSDEEVEAIRTALGSDHAADIRTFDCSSCDLPDRRRLDDAGVRRLAIFAGDGTISNYLGRLEGEGWQGAALPLPGGTKNLLCTDMFGTLAATDLAAMYRRGELCETHRDCMRCGSFTALAEILAGPGARWADVREDIRRHEIGEALATSLDIAEEALHGEYVRLVEPQAGSSNGYPGLHFSLSGGAIEARGYPLETPGDWIGQGWAMATRDFREGPFDDLGRMERAICAVTGGEDASSEMDLMIDGERENCGGRVEIRRDTFRISLLAPCS